MAKISSRKTQNIANPQKQTPAKISCHTVDLDSLWNKPPIEQTIDRAIHHFWSIPLSFKKLAV